MRRVVTAAAFFALSWGSSGCVDRACIQWSAEDGACPAPGDALAFMQGDCGGNVLSVDSGADFDGQACCYDVTERKDSDAPMACAGPRPPNPPPPGVSVAVSAVSASASGVGGSGGVGGMGGAGGIGGGGGAPCSLDGRGECVPDCQAPAMSTSAGECVSLGGVVECNPVTNEGCDRAIGEACDLAPGGGGFVCYPAPNIEDLCAPCGSRGAGYCTAGHTCFGTCFRYCCDLADCGPTAVACFKDPFPQSLITSVGVCVVK